MPKHFTIFLLLVFSFLAYSKDSLEEWAQNVLNDPGPYFVSDYEEQIFLKFKKKFSSLKLLKVKQLDGNRLVELQLTANRNPYYLLFQMENAHNIKRICRYLPVKEDVLPDAPENKGLQWIGKFLYRLDAGDSTTILDLIFYKKIKISYRKLADKSEIVARLIKDFSSGLDLVEINIQENSGVYGIQILPTQLNEIVVEIPVELTASAEPDDLQEKLFEKIKTFIELSSMDKVESANESEPNRIETILHLYPNSRQKGDTLFIPYPENRLTNLRYIHYLVSPSNSENKLSGSHASPIISLMLNQSKDKLILNNTLPIPYYVSSSDNENNLKSIEKLLQSVFIMFLEGESGVTSFIKTEMTGEVEYRGYVVQKIGLSNYMQLDALWEVLHQEGTLYYYPSQIDQQRNRLSLKGILYIIGRLESSFYHFCELILTVDRVQNPSQTHIAITFYPYIRRTGLSELNSPY